MYRWGVQARERRHGLIAKDDRPYISGIMPHKV
jgi:hypothetical protein